MTRRWIAAAAMSVALAGCTTSVEPPVQENVVSQMSDIQSRFNRENAPVLDFTPPFRVEVAAQRIVEEGKGEPIKEGQRVTLEYLAVNGTTGQSFASKLGNQAMTTIFGDEANSSGVFAQAFYEALNAKPVGTTLLLAVPGQEGTADNQLLGTGVGPNDTVIFWIKIVSARDSLTRATGTAMPAKEGLPKLTVEDSGEPSLSFDGAKTSSTFVNHVAIEGQGKVVEPGASVTIHYSGWIWRERGIFGSSWGKGPATIQLGSTDKPFIRAWEEGIVGQKVGSQLLMVVPPDWGYGALGDKSYRILGTDTLVYVIDILDTGDGSGN